MGSGLAYQWPRLQFPLAWDIWTFPSFIQGAYDYAILKLSSAKPYVLACMTLISMTCIISASVAIHKICFTMITVKNANDFSYEHLFWLTVINWHKMKLEHNVFIIPPWIRKAKYLCTIPATHTQTKEKFPMYGTNILR